MELEGEFVPEPLHILNKIEVQLRRRTIVQLKVQWKNFKDDEANWENEATMRKAYLALFNDVILSPWNTRDGVVLSGEGCNISNFGPNTYRHEPIDYDVILMFLYIGLKTPLHMNMMICFIHCA